METSTILISIGVLVALLIVYYYFYQKDKKTLPEEIKLNTPATATAPASSSPARMDPRSGRAGKTDCRSAAASR